MIIEGGRANFAFVVGISATCGGERAGAIVPLLSQRFEREFIKFFPVAPSSAEIQQALSDAEKRAIVMANEATKVKTYKRQSVPVLAAGAMSPTTIM